MNRTKRHILFLLFITINLFCLQKIEVNAWPGIDGWNIENMKTYNDFQYMYMPETDSITIVGYVGTEEVVVVPSEIDGKCVKEIVNFDDYANYKWYEPNEAIKEIYIPEGVTSIGGFHNCINVEKVHLSNSVQVVGADAFENCEKLKEVTGTSNLVQIESGAFSWCKKLKKVNLPYGLKEIGSAAFSNCYALKEINIPDSVIEIGKEAFSGCKQLSKVKLSKNIVVIKKNSFSYCDIKSIKIPNKVTKIEERAFSSNSLKEILIPSSVKSIGTKSFAYCKKLKKITIKGTKVKKIGKKAFYLANKKVIFDVPNKCIKKYKNMIVKSKSFKDGKIKIK